MFIGLSFLAPHRHRRRDGVLHAADGRRRRRGDRPRSAVPDAAVCSTPRPSASRRRRRPSRSPTTTPTTRKAAPARARRVKRVRWVTRTPRRRNKRYGVQGPQDNPDPHIARQAALREAAEFGMIGLLNVGAGGDPNAPTAPWGRDDSLGNDPLSARGNMWGDAIGDSFGAGGLGLSGIGEGGGGRGEGIGLGNIGTHRSRRRHRHRSGLRLRPRPPRRRRTRRKPPAGPHGRDAGQRSPPAGGHPAHRAPELRSLPSLLRERPAQQPEPPGSRLGARSSSAATARSRQRRQRRLGPAGSAASSSCVVRGFYGLSFPQPEGGIVTVVYPIMFNPGD